MCLLLAHKVIFASPSEGALEIVNGSSLATVFHRTGLWATDSDSDRHTVSCLAEKDGMVYVATVGNLYAVDVRGGGDVGVRFDKFEDSVRLSSCVAVGSRLIVGGAFNAYSIGLARFDELLNVVPVPSAESLNYAMDLRALGKVAFIAGCAFAKFASSAGRNCSVVIFDVSSDAFALVGDPRQVAEGALMPFTAVSNTTHGLLLERDGTVWVWEWASRAASPAQVTRRRLSGASFGPGTDPNPDGTPNAWFDPSNRGLQAAAMDSASGLLYLTATVQSPVGSPVPFVQQVWRVRTADLVVEATASLDVCAKFDECVISALSVGGDAGQVLSAATLDPGSFLSGNTLLRLDAMSLKLGRARQLEPTAGWFKFLIQDPAEGLVYVMGEKLPMAVLEFDVTDTLAVERVYFTDLWGPSHVAASLEDRRVYVCDRQLGKLVTLDMSKAMQPMGKPLTLPCASGLLYGELAAKVAAVDVFYRVSVADPKLEEGMQLRGQVDLALVMGIPASDILSATFAVAERYLEGISLLIAVVESRNASRVVWMNLGSEGVGKNTTLRAYAAPWPHGPVSSLVYDPTHDILIASNATAIHKLVRSRAAGPLDPPFEVSQRLVLGALLDASNRNRTTASRAVIDNRAGVGYFFGAASHVMVVCLSTMTEIGTLVVTHPDDPAVFELTVGYVNPMNGMILFAGRESQLYYASPVIRQLVVDEHVKRGLAKGRIAGYVFAAFFGIGIIVLALAYWLIRRKKATSARYMHLANADTQPERGFTLGDMDDHL